MTRFIVNATYLPKNDTFTTAAFYATDAARARAAYTGKDYIVHSVMAEQRDGTWVKVEA